MHDLVSPASTDTRGGALSGLLLPGESWSAGPSKRTLRHACWRITSGAHKSWAAMLFNTSIMALIFANVVLVVIDTEPSIHEPPEQYERFSTVYRSFEWASVVIFATEYLVRLWSCVEDPTIKQSIWRACARTPGPTAAASMHTPPPSRYCDGHPHPPIPSRPPRLSPRRLSHDA